MDEIKVWIGEYKKALAPDELYSDGLGSCIAIGAIYKKKGYMLHSVDVNEDLNKLNQLLGDLKKDVKDLNKLQIYIAGGECFLFQGISVIPQRSLVLNKIEEYGFEKCIKQIKWSEPGNPTALRLLLSEKRGEIEEYENYEELDPLDNLEI